jgi:hypothetical protein
MNFKLGIKDDFGSADCTDLNQVLSKLRGKEGQPTNELNDFELKELTRRDADAIAQACDGNAINEEEELVMADKVQGIGHDTRFQITTAPKSGDFSQKLDPNMSRISGSGSR